MCLRDVFSDMNAKQFVISIRKKKAKIIFPIESTDKI